jgi:hypothetical protein
MTSRWVSDRRVWEQIAERGATLFDRLAPSGTLCACPKIVMTTMSLRLSAGARSEEVFAKHSRERFGVAGEMAWRESVIVHLD